MRIITIKYNKKWKERFSRTTEEELTSTASVRECQQRMVVVCLQHAVQKVVKSWQYQTNTTESNLLLIRKKASERKGVKANNSFFPLFLYPFGRLHGALFRGFQMPLPLCFYVIPVHLLPCFASSFSSFCNPLKINALKVLFWKTVNCVAKDELSASER